MSGEVWHHYEDDQTSADSAYKVMATNALFVAEKRLEAEEEGFEPSIPR